MFPETLTASFIVLCLATFFAINFYNLLRFHRGRNDVKVYAEIRRPKSFSLQLAAFGTMLFFLESIMFSFLAFAGFTSPLHIFPLQLQFQHDSYVQIAGIVLTGAGYFLFIWSVVARGRYAVSWAMSEDHKLVTWGPYRYVRHPSYLGYFLMFSGLFVSWLNLLAVFPLAAIPGYMQVAAKEEELLTRRFGEEYVRYQRTTGRFLPKRKGTEN